MPSHEAIVNTIIPQVVDKPIPVRTVQTRVGTRPQAQNVNQPDNAVSNQAAEPAATAESVRLSPQLSALARKEQALRQERAAFMAEKKALEARLAEAEQYSQLKTKLTSKDFSAAEELGLSYEEYTKYLLDKQAGEDPNTLAFKKLEDEIQTLKKGQEEKAAQEYEETVAEYRQEIAKLIESSPDFPKVKKAKAEKAVLQLILDSWEEDGVEVTIQQASKDVELFLNEEAKKWAALTEEPESSPGVPERVLPPPRPGSKTLTQQMQPPSGQKAPAKSLQHLSENERYAEARRRVLERRQQGV
jgi:hypothetical protein